MTAEPSAERAMIEEPCEFWFVWTKYGRVPQHAHDDAFRAEAEAERLARKNPGQKYIVLRAYTKLSFARTNDETITRTEGSTWNKTSRNLT